MSHDMPWLLATAHGFWVTWGTTLAILAAGTAGVGYARKRGAR